MSVSRPDRSSVPGRAPVPSPSTTVSTPADEHVLHPLGVGDEPLVVAGQVVAHAHRAGVDGRGVEHHHVGERARRHRAAIAQPEQRSPAPASSAAPPTPSGSADGHGGSRRGSRSDRARRTSDRGGRRRRSRRSGCAGPPTAPNAASSCSGRHRTPTATAPCGGRRRATTSSRASKSLDAPLGGDVAHKPTRETLVRGRERVADAVAAPTREPADDAGLLRVARRSFSVRRTSGSRSCSHLLRRAAARARPSSPASNQNAQNVDPSFMFMPTIVGIVSATTRPPISAARSDARSWCGMRSGSRASTLSTFQFSGRCATRDICAMRSISSSLKPLRQPSVMYSSVVPG